VFLGSSQLFELTDTCYHPQKTHLYDTLFIHHFVDFLNQFGAGTTGAYQIENQWEVSLSYDGCRRLVSEACLDGCDIFRMWPSDAFVGDEPSKDVSAILTMMCMAIGRGLGKYFETGAMALFIS
jgi:hypothetical protein